MTYPHRDPSFSDFRFFPIFYSPEVPGGGLSSLMTTGTIIGTARTREVGNKMQAQARNPNSNCVSQAIGPLRR